MGRRKSKPHRSVGILVEANATAEAEPDKHNAIAVGEEEKCDFDKPYFVEVDRSGWLSDEHLDISEVVLTDLNLREGFNGFVLSEDFYQDPQFSLRFRLCNVSDILGRIKLGHWPVLPYTDIHLEFVKRATVDNNETCTVLLSGIFDGPDEGVSGLVHLMSLKFVTLRAVIGIRLSEDTPSLRIRVEVLKSAFDACESLLEVSRQLWKKSMMNVMSWLRPEIMTSEVRYGFSSYMDMDMDMEVNSQNEMADGGGYAGKCSRFDPAGFYEAIKPSKAEPMLEDDIPELLPELRPYQRRAVFWMVKREKVMEESQSESERNLFHSPLCVPVDFLDTRTKMFFNPFSGNISLCPETSSPYVFGGILADEMGLGKTVELLACIFAHRKSAYKSDIPVDSVPQVNGDEKVALKRLKRERVECICGAVSESLKYQGLWVQCDICDAWQHADCVGYSPKGKPLKSKQGLESKAYKTTIAVRNGEYVCQMCSELIQATETPIASGATLIVCPAPILPQWHDEIIRHTRPGALKTCIYDGVRETSFSNKPLMDVSDLASADIVLTTYDVLKEDLSHDSDRHIGDRHLLRFQKRYPVIPTLLTRIYWWRICLDEAQMVESTVATAATEMALRLHCKHRWCVSGTPIQRKLDDLFGLLRFIKTSPFNLYRWWSEVIRDPYETGDMGAMEFTHRIFKQIMWRSSKQHVVDELDLPSQQECLSLLTLSPVEEHFYQRQHEACVRDSHDIIESLRNDILNRKVPDSVSMSGSSDPLITHTEAGKLLNALLKLRQACCHPQVGSSGLRSIQQSPMTIEEVLMVLISKTKIEGEEALRRLAIALNALAAIFVIQKDYYQAALLYNEALAMAEEHSEDFRLDPLLNIHIHHNLADIFPLAQNFALILPSKGKQFSATSAVNTTKKHFIVKVDHDQVKRHKISSFDDAISTVASAEPSNVASSLSENDLNDRECDALSASSVKYLIAECEDSKQKYLSVFSSKLAAAQQEFQSSYTQVCKAYHDSGTNQTTFWWLEAKIQGGQISLNNPRKREKHVDEEANIQKRKRRRKKKKQKQNVDLDDTSRLQRRTRNLLIRMKQEQNLIDAYSGEGWKGQSREKIRPEMELQRAKKQILKCKLSIRDAIRQLDSLSSVGSIEGSVIAKDGSVSHEHIFCANCKMNEAFPDNDIILCDGTCNRAFHQRCLDPPLDTENIPPGDQGWFCKFCECKIEILEATNAHLGTRFSLDSTWQDVFKEEAAIPDGDDALLNQEEEWPSDDPEDDDYNPEGKEDSHDGINTEGNDENASDDSSSSGSMWSLNGECSLLDEGINLEYYSVNGHVDSDESGEIACGRRQRRAVDYKQLYDEMFGKDALPYEQVSEDEDWGPGKRRRREKESDAVNTLMTLHESENKHPNKEKKDRIRGDSSGIKRPCFRLPHDAVQKLRQVFTENELPPKSVKDALSQELGIDAAKVNKWFKNARYMALKMRKHREGGEQPQSIASKTSKDSTSQHVQKDEILKPEVSKVTVVHSQKKIENVTDKEKTKASSSPLKKKRKRPEIPPPLSENGNKESMEVNDDFNEDVSLMKLLKERKKKVGFAFEGNSEAAEMEFERLSKVKMKLDRLKQKLSQVQNCRSKGSDEVYLNEPSIIYVPVAELREKVK